MQKFKTVYLVTIIPLIYSACVNNRINPGRERVGLSTHLLSALEDSTGALEDSTKFDKSEFPESSVIPRKMSLGAFNQYEIKELSLLIDLPDNMYIITRDRYSEGIENIPWIRAPNKSLRDDFGNKNIYFLGVTDNMRLEIIRAENDVSRRIYNLEQIDEYEIADFLKLLSTRREQKENYCVFWKFNAVYKSGKEMFLKFSTEEFGETTMETNIYYTIKNGTEIMFKFYTRKADGYELEILIQSIIDGLSFL
jgi:hypothetical protein